MSHSRSAVTRFLERLRPSYFFAGAVVLALHLAGTLQPLDRSLLAQRFEWLPRGPSNALVIVEIDAQSLHAIDIWPWPRRYYAEIVERLLDGGARQIVIDIDFSARSPAADDEALARAIARAGDQLVLPTFIQRQQALSASPLLENAPHQAVRGQARLGTVNVRPEADGRVWRYSVADELPSGFRPSLAVALGGTGAYEYPDFLIDYGIALRAIERVSFVDLLRGSVRLDLVRGRDVLVGSTAAELGDYLAVPIYRSLPGVLMHALAYESVVQKRMIQRTGPVVTAVGLLILLFGFAPAIGSDRRSWGWGLATAVAVSGVIVALATFLQARYAISVDSAAWLVAIVTFFLAGVLHRVRAQAITLFRQRMAQTHMRALMRAVVEDSFDGVIIANSDGYIELANRAAISILRRSDVSLAGIAVEAVLPMGPPTGMDAGGRDITVRRGDGTLVPLEVMLSTSEIRRSRRRWERRRHPRQLFIYTFRDTTARQEAANAQQAALQAAVAASRAKSEFLANMSHELRTPLNAIIGFSETMTAGIFGPIGSVKYMDYLRDIERSGRHLLGVIDQVLDVSRIEAGTTRMQDEAIAIGDLVADCQGIMRGWLATRPRNMAVDLAADFPAIRGDRQMLRQVLLNLLSNAVKFTKDGGQIMLRAFLDAEGRPTIVVEDSGVGIPAGKMERLTQAFYQVDASAEGTGLGLYLARHFVEAHGGSMAFRSVVGSGTTVSIVLPRDRLLLALVPLASQA